MKQNYRYRFLKTPNSKSHPSLRGSNFGLVTQKSSHKNGVLPGLAAFILQVPTTTFKWVVGKRNTAREL